MPRYTRREIFIGEPRISKQERQDTEITEAAQLWRDGFVTAEDLLADAVCRVYRSNSLGLGEAGVDVPGSMDVYVRCHDEHLLTDEMYDAILKIVDESGQLVGLST